MKYKKHPNKPKAMRITENLIFEKNVIFGDNANLAEAIHAFFVLYKANFKAVII
jgi:hypothetical protein